ncbi:MAG: OmpA family protein [Muribaculaceae bacterium]|nr:OmpA family protein [Muribaculaceae bacterium]
MNMKKIFFIICVFALCGCNAPKLSKADEAFDRGEYFDAQQIYKKVYNKLSAKKDRQLRGEVAFKQGLCYDKLNMSANASKAFQNAKRYDYSDSILYLYLGKALQGEGKYDAAINAYDTYLSYAPDNALAKEGINGCRMAIMAKTNRKTRYIVKKAQLFNSPRADYAPMYLDKNLDQLYFTSNTEKATGNSRSEITGMKRGDIYVSRKDEKGNWKRPEPVEGGLNTEADEGIICFSPDGQTMYLTRARRSETSNTSVEIYTSKRSDATWSEPQKFEITSDTLSAVGHPSVSSDGTYLYFCSDMPGGFGGLDIWRINLKERAGSLENLGPQINTQGNEMFPYSRTDSLLYFSSDGHPGFGGLDLFKAKLNTTGDYWSVENLGLPLNSKGDDFGITFGNGENGFLSSNRDDGRGRDHIYSFELPDIHITISGWVLDKDEEPVANAIIRIVGDDGSNQKEVSRDDGSFRFNLDRGVRYVMKAGATGYLNVKQEFVSDSAEEDADYAIDFILAAVNKPQVIENIFYDFDKATLRPESKDALDELAQMMRDNPHITIEMAAHTDRKGSDEYNISLSERRAKSVVDYLIAAGISPDRMNPKGYGEAVPKTVTKRINREYPQFPEGTVLTEEYILTLSPEDQEAADQINRRTEFQVLSLDYF